ncbi:hypothetical protein HYALB_00003721 [Hymenoscyphus albidus]|uniref:Dolichyl-diphosphooligosaccharide-protein glycosyltransferase subunit OST5 n=1 Tax=Hymenoscyphus albidus TaxID=595503 RepID=A0A9N9M0H5_9HELO|nr:hypothetical protein HYALB_00003721 [Hymenoscyphus albidus]
MPDFGGLHSWTSKLRAFLKTPSSSTTKHSSIRAQKKRTSIPFQPVNPNLMDTSLHHVWESASGNPFIPTVSKDSHFVVGFSLLTIGLLLSGLFGLNRSVVNIPLIGIPASLSIAFGAVYMICAVGVYV